MIGTRLTLSRPMTHPEWVGMEERKSELTEALLEHTRRYAQAYGYGEVVSGITAMGWFPNAPHDYNGTLRWAVVVDGPGPGAA